MIEMIKSWVINIAALVMLIVFVEMLVPSGKLKKMISLVTGFILIIAIITPILGFLKKGGELKDLQVSQSAFLDQKELEVSADKLSKKQSAIIVSTYKSKLKKDVEANLTAIGKFSDVEADVMVEENSESKEFGMIRKISVNLKEKKNEKDQNEVKPVIAIKRVNIGGSTKNETAQKDGISEDVRNEVRNKLAKLYGINPEQVQVDGL
jgi:stage III sporulation protein AF